MRLAYVISVCGAIIGIALICIALIPVLLASIDNARQAANDFSTAVHSSVYRDITATITSVTAMMQLFTIEIEQRGIYLPRDEQTLGILIRKVLQQYPAVEFITFGTANNDALEADDPFVLTGDNYPNTGYLKIMDSAHPCRTTFIWNPVNYSDLSNVNKTDCTYVPTKRSWYTAMQAQTKAGALQPLSVTPPTLGFTRTTMDYYVGRAWAHAAAVIDVTEPVKKNTGSVVAALSTASLSNLLRTFTLSQRGVLALLDIGIQSPVAISTSENVANLDGQGLIVNLKSIGNLTNAYVKAALADIPALRTNGTLPSLVAQTIGAEGLNLIVRAQDIIMFSGLLQLRLILIVPEEDYTDSITESRNTVIIIVVCVSVALLMLQLLLFVRIMKPLSDISEQMQDLAALDTETAELAESDFSSLTEIRAIQAAYAGMRTTMVSFVRYVPKEVVMDLMEAGSVAEIGMEQRQCAVMFVDIESYTHLTETLGYDELADFMQKYYNCQTNIVLQHGGVIDKFIGDAIMAMWGAPNECELMELKAATTALRLRDEVHGVLPHVNVRVGVSAGRVMAGNIGGRDRISYTVVGDVVNTAARIEALNKEFNTRIMVTDAVWEQVRTALCTRLLGAVKVYGKEKPTLVYELMGVLSTSTVGDGSVVRISSRSSTGSEASVRTGSPSSPRRHVVNAERIRRARAKANRKRNMLLSDMDLLQVTTHNTVQLSQLDIKFAESFTAAVNCFISGQFSQALHHFSGCTKGRNLGPGTAHMIELCDEYMRGAAPSDFDGSMTFGKGH